MFARSIKVGNRTRDEAEKPFWISYADLMTALMVLFLVVMSVALLAVTREMSEQEKRKVEHAAAIDAFLADLEKAAARRHPDIQVDRDRRVIDFGSRATFADRRFDLSPDQARAIRAFVPEILALADDPRGRKVLKRVIVEGFTSRTGTYLFNLNLSLQRSQAVLCALFAAPAIDEAPFTEHQLSQIRNQFLVGGYSFNSIRPTDDASRRVELRLEFYAAGEENVPPAPGPVAPTGTCQLPS